MSSNYLFDSSAWLEYFNGSAKGEKVAKLMLIGKAGISIIGVAELADKAERSGHDFERQLSFLKSNAIIFDMKLDLVVAAAKLKRQAREKRPKFSLADAIQLVTAQQNGLSFVTADHDFDGLPEVLVI